jgi:hypothetical protein
MPKTTTSIVSRILFLASALLGALAVCEKLANLMGQTVLRGAYSPWRLLEFAVVALLFVIALQLREIHHALGGSAPVR